MNIEHPHGNINLGGVLFMNLNAKRLHISNLLEKNNFLKSKRYSNRYKGLPHITHGFTFKKVNTHGDAYYLVYFETGDFGYKDILTSEQNKKTKAMYNFLLKECDNESIVISTGYYDGLFCIEIQ